jgi:hypothetical protein
MKPWYTSKTIWFNILTAAGAVAAGVVGLLPTIQVEMTATTYNYLIFGFGVLNITLRAVTKHGLSVKA